MSRKENAAGKESSNRGREVYGRHRFAYGAGGEVLWRK